MGSRKQQMFKGEMTDREIDLINLERDRLEFELAMSSIMTEPDTAERQRKLAWIKSMHDTTNLDRQIEKTVAARIAEWKHEIAGRVSAYIGLIVFVVAVAALNGVPVFSAKMAWLVIIIAVLSTLYELWG